MDTDPITTCKYSVSDAIGVAATDAGLTGEQLDQIIETHGREIVGGYDMRPGRKGERSILNAIASHVATQVREATTARLGGPAATPAQRRYLVDLGATAEQIDQCTKATASTLIDELKAKNAAVPAGVRRAQASAAYHGAELGEIWD